MLNVNEDKINQDQQQTEDVAVVSPSLTEANTLPSSSYIHPKSRKDAVVDPRGMANWKTIMGF